jgi:predicted PurR-regulated permease PerM
VRVTDDEAHARARAARDHDAPAEERALGVIAIAAVVVIVWIALPVGVGILLGALLAFTVYPELRRLTKRTHRPVLVAAVLTAGATILVAGTLGLLGYALIAQGIAFLRTLPAALAPGGAAEELLRRAAAPLAILGLEPSHFADRLRQASGEIATTLAGAAAQVVGVVLDGVLALFFMAITMYFMLRNWRAIARRAERLVPIDPRHTRLLLRELQKLGRHVVVGNIGTAMVQGTLAGVGYAIARVPEPAFFGAITAVASLLPVFGTLLVWVPAGIVLIVSGHVAAGAFEHAWGTAVVVGFCDYFVRPKLVGPRERMSTWLTFVALFGGLKLMGFVGFLVGPLAVGIAVATLRLYERERRLKLRSS